MHVAELRAECHGSHPERPAVARNVRLCQRDSGGRYLHCDRRVFCCVSVAVSDADAIFRSESRPHSKPTTNPNVNVHTIASAHSQSDSITVSL